MNWYSFDLRFLNLFRGSCFSGSGFFGVLGTAATSFSTTTAALIGIYLRDASTIGVALAVYGIVGFLTALELPLLYIILKDLTSLGFNLKVIIIP